jgi:hypothetical protein
MDPVRVRNEFFSARQQFPNLELYQDYSGQLYIKAALQTTNSCIYIVTIQIPTNYPNVMPEVYVIKPIISLYSPHKYVKGNICYIHPSLWNPGKHNLMYVVARIAKWLNKYEVWKVTTRWPGAEILHHQ